MAAHIAPHALQLPATHALLAVLEEIEQERAAEDGAESQLWNPWSIKVWKWVADVCTGRAEVNGKGLLEQGFAGTEAAAREALRSNQRQNARQSLLY